MSITKRQSDIVKGIAILLMLLHHGFTFPKWIIRGGYSPDLAFAGYFNSPTKLCVCIFAFITGWAYALKKTHTFGESANRLKKFLISYWVVCIPSMAFAVVCGGYNLQVDSVFELFGLTSNVMIFCWYVAFYVVSMLLLSVLYRILDRSFCWSVFSGIVLPIIAFVGLRELSEGTVLENLFNNLKHWFPCISVGYICNRYELFTKTRKVTASIPAIAILALGTLFCGFGRYFVSALDFVYCAVLTYSIVNFIQSIGNVNVIVRGLEIIGGASTNMWFIHCLYFNGYTRSVIQPLAYWSSNPFLIYSVLVMEVFAVGWLLTKLDKHVIARLKL